MSSTSTPRRWSSSSTSKTWTSVPGAPSSTTTTSSNPNPTPRDLHIVFLYDLLRNKNEADDPIDSILYFSPQSIPQEKRVGICGQLMGLTHFMTFNFSSPSLIRLGNGKFSLRKLSDQFVLAIGSSSATPDWLIRQQINMLVELLAFYHSDFTGKILKNPDFKLAYILDYYLDIVSTNDIFSLSFGILPLVNLPKSAPGVSLKGSLILQSCRLRKGVLGGILMYQTRVVTVEILESIGQKLAFIKQDRIPPGDLATQFPKLPPRVQLLNIYITSKEFDELTKTSLKYQAPAHQDSFSEINESKPQQSNTTNCELILEEPLDSNHNNNPTSTSTPTFTQLRRCQSLIHIELQSPEEDTSEKENTNNNVNGKWNSCLNLQESRDQDQSVDRDDYSSFEEIEVMKIQNQNHSNMCGYSHSDAEDGNGSSIPEFIPCNVDSSDCGSSSGPGSIPPDQNNSFHQIQNQKSPYTNSHTLSSTESLHHPTTNFKLKRLKSPNKKCPLSNNPESTTYEPCLLYIFNDGYMRLFLVLSQQTDISVIENITSYCESILPELKTELSLVENLDPVQVDPYCFLRYESMWKSLSGGRNNETMDTHAIQLIHQNFQVYPDINELIIRANDHVMYGYQCVGSEVYYQQRAGLQPGLPMPSDLMGKVPDKAKRRLERDHSILLL